MAHRYLVTGTEGQVVGALLEKAAGRDDIEIVLIGLPELDLSDTTKIAPAIEALKPDVILSVAAYTAVDAAETDEALALAINGTALGEIGRAAARLGVPVVHLSTDYVFDGEKPAPYVETDPTGPVGAYGRTKLAGELALAAATPDHAILRTAWVYSPFGKNFVKTMLRLAETRDRVGVVADQIGNPTSALDIAEAMLVVAGNLLAAPDPTLRGLFHMTGTGEAAWADFAAEIFRVSAACGGPSAEVERIPTSAYPTPARRPTNSRLDCGKLERVHGVRLPAWTESTEVVVRRLVGGQPA
ncbi:dTDP-4-dehydrorhamnose reductase [Siculibacillus lacustris]